jgi:hypothetical protein
MGDDGSGHQLRTRAGQLPEPPLPLSGGGHMNHGACPRRGRGPRERTSATPPVKPAAEASAPLRPTWPSVRGRRRHDSGHPRALTSREVPAVSLRENPGPRPSKPVPTPPTTGRPYPAAGRSGDRWVSEHRFRPAVGSRAMQVRVPVLAAVRPSRDETHEVRVTCGAAETRPLAPRTEEGPVTQTRPAPATGAPTPRTARAPTRTGSRCPGLATARSKTATSTTTPHDSALHHPEDAA